jgi:ABC-2 type transport system permease protein
VADVIDDGTRPSNVRRYRTLVVAGVRAEVSYRASFVTMLASNAVVTGLDLASLLALFHRVDQLGGWSARQVLVLYSLSAVGFSVADGTVGSVDKSSEYVRMGTFDRLLLRPMSTLGQLLVERFEVRRMGRMVLPLTVLAVIVTTGHTVHWSAVKVVLVPVVVASSAVMAGSLFVATSSISFWLVSSQELSNAFTYGGAFASQYPTHIFGTWLKQVMLFVVPIGAVNYLPAMYLSDAPNPLGVPRWVQLAGPLASLPMVAVATMLWRSANRHYQSTGS